MLTRRQAEIAALVARGLSDKAIAREASISPLTVRRHIHAAAERIPGAGKPRHRLTLWFLSITEDGDPIP